MKLEINGIQYSNFVSASCTIQLDALSNTFSFEAALPEGEPLPFKGGDPVKVLVDDELVLTGNIEIIEVDYDADDHTITVSGRDKTGDLLDSTLNADPDLIGENLTLKGVIEAVIKNIGSDIKVIDNVNPRPYDLTEDIASPESGDNAFAFIEKFSRKRQVLLTSDADGNVVIEKNTGQTAEGGIQHIIGADDNNVMSSTFRFDTTGRFNVYKFDSQLNPVALDNAGDTDLASLVNQSGRVSDDDIRVGRQLVLVAESPFSSTFDEARAKWELDIRRARGLIYSAVVPGFRVGVDTGNLWTTNRLYQIVDDYLGKSEPMLANSTTFTLDLTNGRQTTIGFVDEKAYTLSLKKPNTSEVATDVV